jgi:amino acid adenylation domain-containing protein
VLIDFNEQRTSLDESATNRISFQTLFAQTNATSSNAPLESHHYQENDVVYILHTSGSTGQPKCVQITERNIKAYFRAHNQVLRFNDASKVFSLTPFHFDVSIEDTLLPLSVGATVYQYNRLHQGRIIRKTLIEQNVTHLIAVSTLLTMISDDESQINPDNFPHLSMVMTGAEVCAPNVINLWKERLPSTRVINAYGPTEVTIVATCYTIESAERNRDIAYPIGQPLDGVRVRLLDEYGQDVEPGSSGELCLGGDQVMLGYLNKPDETAERIFVQDDVRYYRTGDICFVDHNGDLQFVGRNDNEVKIKGRRIHLGEIQQQCMAVPGVERAAVGVHQRQGQPMISAVITTQERDKIEQVQAHLRSLLPSYMMPVIWGTTENVTLAASGKSNDKQLLRQLSEVFEQTSASIISLTE